MSSSASTIMTVGSVAAPDLVFTYIFGSQTVTCTMPDGRQKKWQRSSKSSRPFWDSFDRDLDELKQAYEHELTGQGVKPDGWPDHPETGVSIGDRKWFPSEAAEIKWEWVDGRDTAEADGGGTTDGDGNEHQQNGE